MCDQKQCASKVCSARDTPKDVTEISIRELRNHGGEVVDRVALGEHITVTRDGRPVAQLTPLLREPLRLRLQQAEPDFAPLTFDAACARMCGRVAASLHQAGRKTRARSFDAMIAATALSNDLPLYTCNHEDFDDIEGLDLQPIPHLDGS